MQTMGLLNHKKHLGKCMSEKLGFGKGHESFGDNGL